MQASLFKVQLPHMPVVGLENLMLQLNLGDGDFLEAKGLPNVVTHEKMVPVVEGEISSTPQGSGGLRIKLT